MSVTNNIAFKNDRTISGTEDRPYAVDVRFSVPNITFGGTGQENVFNSAQTSCRGAAGPYGACDSAFSVLLDDQPLPSGANFYGTSPGFINPTDLLANHTGAPDCTGFISITSCMGYNAYTQTVTSLSVIEDLTANPNCGGVTGRCVGKGYQLPSTNCVTSSSTGFGGRIYNDYPAWLKGIVYLHSTTAVMDRSPRKVILSPGRAGCQPWQSAYVTSTTYTSNAAASGTITKPTTQTNDLMIAFLAIQNSNLSGVVNTLAGWNPSATLDTQ